MKPPFLSCSLLPPSPFSSSTADVRVAFLRMRVWARLLLSPLWRLLPRLSLVSFPASVASVVSVTAPLAVVIPAVVRPHRRRWCPCRRGCVRRGGYNIVDTAAFAAATASIAVIIPLRAIAFATNPSVVIVIPANLRASGHRWRKRRNL